MRRYETIYIINPKTSEDDITAVIDRTHGIIEQFGGQIVQIDRWGLKKLAYLINKETQGYYVYSEYAGVPEAVDELERLFRIDEKVFKYMTIKTQDVFIPDPPKPEVQEEESTGTEDAPAEKTAETKSEDAETKSEDTEQ